MKIRDFIQNEVFGARAKQAGCLVIYDPQRRYQEIANQLQASNCRVVDASHSVIEAREAAMHLPIPKLAWPVSCLKRTQICFLRTRMGNS
jgi:hypothetical protein